MGGCSRRARVTQPTAVPLATRPVSPTGDCSSQSIGRAASTIVDAMSALFAVVAMSSLAQGRSWGL